MIAPDLPADETGRLEALRALRILDTPPEQCFDRITSLATRLLRVPKASISLVDADRVWLKSQASSQLRKSSSAAHHSQVTENARLRSAVAIQSRKWFVFLMLRSWLLGLDSNQQPSG